MLQVSAPAYEIGHRVVTPLVGQTVGSDEPAGESVALPIQFMCAGRAGRTRARRLGRPPIPAHAPGATPEFLLRTA